MLSFICGASLVTPRWAMTAAHCIGANYHPGRYSVLVHAHDLSGEIVHRECTQLVQVEQFRCHPSYDADTLEADLCLLRLTAQPRCADRLVASAALPLIDAPAPHSVAVAGVDAIAAGWGTTSSADGNSYAQEGVPQYPVRLREVVLPVVSTGACQGRYGTSAILPGMICAGREGADTCGGDSGG